MVLTIHYIHILWVSIKKYIYLNYTLFILKQLFLKIYNKYNLILNFNNFTEKYHCNITTYTKWLLFIHTYSVLLNLKHFMPSIIFNFFFCLCKKWTCTIIKSPFVFKKSKEQYLLNSFKALLFLSFKYSNWYFNYFIKEIIIKTLSSTLNLSFFKNILLIYRK